MRKIIGLLSFFLLLGITVLAQNNTPTYSWRMHLPHKSVKHIIDLEDRLLVQSDIGIYTFDLQSGEVEKLTKVDGFSETRVSKIGYSESINTVIIAYDNGDIDLLKGNTIINLPAIKRASIVGVKEVNEIKVDGTIAYLATSFGVVVVDLEKEEVIDDYQNLGASGVSLPIYSIAVHNDSLFLGTTEGVKAAPANDASVNLKNFESWVTNQVYDSALYLTSFEGNLYFTHNNSLFYYGVNGYENLESGSGYRSIVSSKGRLLVSRAKGILQIANNTTEELGETISAYALYDKKMNLWFGGFYSGLIKKDANGNYGYVSPLGPYGTTSYQMTSQGNKLWVTSGGHTSAYAPSYISTGIYTYEDGTWKNLVAKDTGVSSLIDYTSIYVDDNELYAGSFGSGFLEMQNGEFKTKYTEINSSLNTLIPGRNVVLGAAKDSKGNLWVANYDADRPLSVRRPDGSWESFQVRDNGVIIKRLGEMVIDDNDQIWMLVPRNSSIGLVAAREVDGRIQARTLNATVNNGGLPNNNVKAIVKDKDGELWVGTETGIAVFFNPQLVFDPRQRANADAQQIIIDDGNDVGYLLGNEVVNDIKVDGGNRKWVATNNGAWLVKEDGSEVLSHFLSENTPLPDNTVNCIGIIPNTGEVFFGTNAGIASNRGDATEASNTHNNTLVFPNPVDKGYQGPITISGLPEDATVKIVDVAGRVVYELISNGGTAVWDGRNFNGEQPQTGVYLIFTGDKESEDTLVSKLLIVR
jgi:ligand-binding sensor domain-containing protein